MPLDIKQDDRGMLYEAFPSDGGQIFVITINPGFTRGNHYHKRKVEKFIVVSGSATIACRNRGTGAYKSCRLLGERPEAVTVTPNITHSITSKEGCVLICWVSEKLNSEDPDTYPEEV